MIEVKHIWFSYEQWGEFVLKDISFSVEKGEIVGVLGANGLRYKLKKLSSTSLR